MSAGALTERTRHHPFLNRQTTGIPVCLADGMMLRYRRHGLDRLGATRARAGCAQEAESADEVEASQNKEGQLVGSVAVVHPSGEGRGDQQQDVHGNRGEAKNLAEVGRAEVVGADGYRQRIPPPNPAPNSTPNTKNIGRVLEMTSTRTRLPGLW